MFKIILIIVLIIINTACSSPKLIQPSNSNNPNGTTLHQEILNNHSSVNNLDVNNSNNDNTTVIYYPKAESKSANYENNKYENNKLTSLNLNNNENQLVESANLTSNKNIGLDITVENNLVKLVLNNPQGKLINSVRTWLSFPPKTANITNLNINNTIFTLAAPDEYKVDTNNGLIKIGISTVEGTRSTTIQLASFQVENLSQYGVPINCYDYSENTDSHCAVWGEDMGNMLANVEGLIIE